MKESESGCFTVQQAQGQAANESAGGRKTKESSEGPEDWTTVSVDANIIDVPSFIKDHRLLRRAHDHNEYRGEEGNCLNPKLIGWRKRREMRTRSMNRSTRPRAVWRNSELWCETHRLRESPRERLRAVTDTDENMDRILITDDSHVKRSMDWFQNL